MPRTNLSDKHRNFICQSIAVGDTRNETIKYVDEEFGIKIEPHQYYYVKNTKKWQKKISEYEREFDNNLQTGVPLTRKYKLARLTEKIILRNYKKGNDNTAISAGYLLASIAGMKKETIENIESKKLSLQEAIKTASDKELKEVLTGVLKSLENSK